MNAQHKLNRWEQRTEWPLAVVAVVFLVVYSMQVLVQPQGQEAHVLSLVSWATYGLFVLDYIARLVLASDRVRWFFRHFFDLAIVALPVLRPLRLLRLVVLVGALQKAAGNAIRGRIIIYTIFGGVLLIWVASLAVLEQERDQPGATINSLGKALWWSITTMTTIGNSDRPVTMTGRIIAVLLWMGSIALIGVVTASLASWIVERVSDQETAKQAVTAAHIDLLRDEIRQLAEELRRNAITSHTNSDSGHLGDDQATRSDVPTR
jgi:voltage-gated potassium channel